MSTTETLAEMEVISPEGSKECELLLKGFRDGDIFKFTPIRVERIEGGDIKVTFLFIGTADGKS